MKNRSTTSRIPVYGGILGLVLCILISAGCGFGYLFAFGDLRPGELWNIDLNMSWLVPLGIFTGPLGAVLGAFVAADLFMPKEEGKKVTWSYPVLVDR